MVDKVHQALEAFRRKIWLKLLRMASQHLPASDVLELLDPFWWEVVRYRLRELSSTDLGLNTARMIVFGQGSERGREVRDSRLR
jgi:hypothetical protein